MNKIYFNKIIYTLLFNLKFCSLAWNIPWGKKNNYVRVLIIK